jgi:hypothetical protein
MKEGPLFHAIDRVFLVFLNTTFDEQPGGRCTFSPGGLFFDNLLNPVSVRAKRRVTLH